MAKVADRLQNSAEALAEMKELLSDHYQPSPEDARYLTQYGSRVSALQEALNMVLDRDMEPEALRWELTRLSCLYHHFRSEERAHSRMDVRFSEAESVYRRMASLVEDEFGLGDLEEEERIEIRNSVRRSRGKPVLSQNSRGGGCD